jgi:hypothetical protein
LRKVPNNGTFRKISLSLKAGKTIRIQEWVEHLQAKGQYGFALETLQNELPEHSSIGVKRALSRLSDKGKVLSIYKGYYLIIPPQYSGKGVLPPSLFLDSFMKYLKRPYYVGLLNAAAYYGAAHQQPQEFFVVTTFPVLRPTKKKGLKINYITVKEIPTKLLEPRKTEAGYLQVSNPALTASTVLNELAEVLLPIHFTEEFIRKTQVTALQRLGFLLEFACDRPELANSLFRAMGNNGQKLFRIPLKPKGPTKGYNSENRWNVINNAKIEIDE